MCIRDRGNAPYKAKEGSYCILKSKLIREEYLTMKPTMEILDRIRENSEKNKDEIFTRLYRYMLRPDLYYTAYKNLYANDGSGTKGVNEDTADAFSDMKINAIDVYKRQGKSSWQTSMNSARRPSRRTA